jgi:hypothetical protein
MCILMLVRGRSGLRIRIAVVGLRGECGWMDDVMI